MSVLSLQEAAERTGTSKVDIWRAIQSGTLSAQRTGDGGFAIDTAALFGVFEAKIDPVAGDAAAAPTISGQPDAPASPEPGTPSDMAIAFAELQDQLRGLLSSVAEAETNSEPPQDQDAPVDDDTTTTEMKTDSDGLETPTPTPTSREVAGTPSKRPWWRRFAG
jgi:hypothetical protein